MRRVAVVGATGNMGTLACAAIASAPDLELVATVSRRRPEAPAAAWSASLAEVDPASVDTVVDLSVADVARATLSWVCAEGRDAVVGTSGLTEADLARAADAARGRARILVVPNFSIGALVCQRLAVDAARYFDAVELVELHFDAKRDAPSGTSMAVARAIAQARSAADLPDVEDATTVVSAPGARGAELEGGVRVHSVRLPGLLAHQEVHFGRRGEGLVIRHDNYDRASYMGGLLMCLRRLDRIEGVEVGLERVLDG